MLDVKECHILLAETGKLMSKEEIEKLRNLLYQLIGQLIDNNLEKIVCKKQ